jgi:ribosomal protein L15
LARSALKPIKILADGELKLKVTVTASAFSESAKEQIEQAGGTATVQ